MFKSSSNAVNFKCLVNCFLATATMPAKLWPYPGSNSMKQGLFCPTQGLNILVVMDLLLTGASFSPSGVCHILAGGTA